MSQIGAASKMINLTTPNLGLSGLFYSFGVNLTGLNTRMVWFL